MKTFEVPIATLKQYMAKGDGPVIAVETPSEIRIYLIVGSYELCSTYPKIDAQAVAVFKQEYLTNPRIIFPLREVKEKKSFTINQTEEEESVQEEPGITTDFEEVVPLLDQETRENTESINPEESIDTDVVG